MLKRKCPEPDTMATLDPGMLSSTAPVQTEYWAEPSHQEAQSHSWWGQSGWFRNTPAQESAVEVNGPERDPEAVAVVQQAPGHALCFNRFASKPKAEKPPRQKRTLRNLQLKGVGGFGTEVMDGVKDYIIMPLSKTSLYRTIGIPPPTAVLLSGTPGSGKTLLAEAVDNELAHVNVQKIDAREIITKMDPVKYLHEMFEKAINNAPALIFIDQLELIARASESKEKSQVVDLRNELIKEISQLHERMNIKDSDAPLGHVLVLAATAHPTHICPSLQRQGRFEHHIPISKPDEAGRLHILGIKTQGMALGPDVDLKVIAKQTAGFVGSDLEELCVEAGLVCVRGRLEEGEERHDQDEYVAELSLPEQLSAADVSGLKIAQAHFVEAITSMKAGCVGNIIQQDIPKVKWEDIGGQDKVKKVLMETLEYPKVYPKFFKQRSSADNSPPGLLLIGPPGCGKTLLAEAIAQESNSNFICIKGPQLLAPYFGQSEANVREIFAKARANAPCVLFFDELDALGTSRGGKGDSTSARVVTALLTELDGVSVSTEKEPVYIVGASNRPNLIDKALLRPGRFGEALMVDLPNLKSRVGIFKALLRETPLSESVSNNDYEALKELAADLKGYSGADLAAICNRARRSAIDRCIEKALAKAKQATTSPDTSQDVNMRTHEALQDDDEVVTLVDLQEAKRQQGPSVSPSQLQAFTPFLPTNYKGASAPANLPAKPAPPPPSSDAQEPAVPAQSKPSPQQPQEPASTQSNPSASDANASE